jgi:hypothetical protein
VTFGPLEYIVIGFPGARLTDDIVPALADLVASGTIRILDLVFVAKDADGEVTVIEFEDIDGADGYIDLEGDVGSVLSEDDAYGVGELLDADSSAVVILWEDVWAQPFADAVLAAGGRIISGERIPNDLVEASFAELPE